MPRTVPCLMHFGSTPGSRSTRCWEIVGTSSPSSRWNHHMRAGSSTGAARGPVGSAEIKYRQRACLACARNSETLGKETATQLSPVALAPLPRVASLDFHVAARLRTLSDMTGPHAGLIPNPRASCFKCELRLTPGPATDAGRQISGTIKPERFQSFFPHPRTRTRTRLELPRALAIPSRPVENLSHSPNPCLWCIASKPRVRGWISIYSSLHYFSSSSIISLVAAQFQQRRGTPCCSPKLLPKMTKTTTLPPLTLPQLS
jgi:hypothetical protein